MTQISWVPAAGAATTTIGGTATTGYAQRLPYWAPEIAALPATTSAAWQALLETSTTTFGKHRGISAVRIAGWANKDGGVYVAFAHETGTATKITLSYRAVGELIRA